MNSSWARIIKVYTVAIRIALSYLSAYYLRRVLGKQWYDKRMETLHPRNAQLLKRNILELKGFFIKIGQLLSIMSNMLPKAFHEPLESLQDQIPARPYAEVKQRIETELGKPVEQIFARFDEQPIAAASIGQAHYAVLKTGEKVVVKVQHLDIEHIARLDMKLIRRIVLVVSWFFDIKNIDYMYTQVNQMLEDELDYKKEASSMRIIAQNLKDNDKLIVPRVFEQYISGKVLVMEYMEGVKISEIQQLKAWGLDTELLAQHLWDIYCEMVFRDGFYHADPHPGNILVQADGKIVLLDFGATALLGQDMRLGISKLIEAALKNDVDAIVETCYDLGFLADGNDAEKLATQFVQTVQKFLKTINTEEILNFKDNVDIFDKNSINLLQSIDIKGLSGTVQVPKDFVLLNRTITLMMGISFTLAPRQNPLEIVQPYIQDYLFKEQGGAKGIAMDFLRRNAMTIASLPNELQRNLQKMRRGELSFHSPDQVNAAMIMRRVVLTFLWAILSCFSFTVYLYLLEKPVLYPDYALWSTGTFTLLFLWSLRKSR
jgi:predicted unusual protein kinase regulating ubiquinone biosynthesis (AarF/ABC1/UbiB family)